MSDGGAGLGLAATAASPAPGPGAIRRLTRTVAGIVGFFVLLAIAWESFKFVGGDPWRYPEIGLFHDPPLRILQASDRQLPHLWDIAAALFQPVQRNQAESLGQFLVGAALFTWQEAFIGFVLGALIGLVLASIFVHSRLLERAFVPYVIASQTIPIVALAPIIVVGFGRGLVAVVFIATYLTFFPVTIAAMRGLSSPDPRSVELMRSYAASRWAVYRKVRLPASVPYLFTALKVAATASIVGAIIGEGPGGVPEGLGRAIINFNQQYITGPEKLWATIFIAAMVGIAFYLTVQIAESLTLRGRRAARS
ncbi:MAG: ABC transporter permease subunit [Chloroflexota bacterium]|nr:ABC transporter permease subunit [Chloroflexota bacterium]